MNLYEITQEQIELNNLLEENYGEITPEIEQALSLNRDNFISKAENYIKAIKNYKSYIDSVSDEIKKLQDKKKVAENAIDKMSEALKNAMNIFDTKKVKVGIFNLSINKTNSVNIINENIVPEKFKTYKPSISKTDIKEAIKNGETVDGVEIVENENIRIK